jgi:hypothetical protein
VRAGSSLARRTSYYLDGADLWSIDSVTLAKTLVMPFVQQPAGGLACDGAHVYWATLSDADAAPNGTLHRLSIGTTTVDVIASAIDPAPGIEWRDGELAVMTTSGLALANDGGLAPWMQATSTSAYKPFALGLGEDWSIAGPMVFRRTVDASAAPWIDAGAPTALLVAGDAATPFVVVQGQGDAGDTVASLRDDAGAPTVDVFDASVRTIVTTLSGTTAIVASDDTIYLVTPNGVTSLYTTSDHVGDVAIDGSWVVWTTRSPAGVWRGALP